jgi:hypothetical protein
MSKRNAQARFSKRRLERYIGELCSLAKELCPEAEIEVEPGIDELDAWIEVIVPDEKEEDVHDALIQRAHDIFMDEGYDIGVHVTERSAHEQFLARQRAGES